MTTKKSVSGLQGTSLQATGVVSAGTQLTAATTVSPAGGVLLTELASAPSPPASGTDMLYAKAGGLFFKNATGVEIGPFVAVTTYATHAKFGTD